VIAITALDNNASRCIEEIEKMSFEERFKEGCIMDAKELMAVIDRGEDSRRQFKAAVLNGLSFATKLLPYRGLGSGVRRALKEYSAIDFVDDRDGNVFKCIVQAELAHKGSELAHKE